MPVVFQKSKDEIRFTVWGTLCQRISDWEYALDEIVFNEQLATGSFHGRFSIRHEVVLQAMQHAKAQGKIMPYYGVGGHRGSCIYRLQRNTHGYNIQVENTTVNAVTEFPSTSNDDSAESLRRRLQTWLALTLRIGEVAPPYLRLKIGGEELQTLRQWEDWQERDAATERYSYAFGQVSMGHGYTIRVVDAQTNHMLDATDYANW